MLLFAVIIIARIEAWFDLSLFSPPKWMIRNWPFPAQNIATSIFMLITRRPRFKNANKEKQVMHESAVFFPLLSCFVRCVPNARPYELNSVAVLTTHSEKKQLNFIQHRLKLRPISASDLRGEIFPTRGRFFVDFHLNHWFTSNEPNLCANWSFFPFQFNFPTFFFSFKFTLNIHNLKITNGFLSWTPRFLNVIYDVIQTN